MVDHYKKCEHVDGDAAAEQFCQWLIENSSTEFMEVNINRTVSCLQGQRIVGYIGNTSVESWSGKARFSMPKLTADVEVEIEYSVDYVTNEKEDFIQFKVIAD